MSQKKQLTIEGILKKYEYRQDKISAQLFTNNNDEIDTARNKEQYPLQMRSGASTPQFNGTMTGKTGNKSSIETRQNMIQKTHKKQDNYNSFKQREIVSSGFSQTVQQKNEYQNLLVKLDRTEEKLVRSERNYAQIWRKYEKLLQESQLSTSKSVEIEQRLRNSEVGDLQNKICILERQVSTYKDCIASKDNNINVLRQKLKQKNQRIVQNDRLLQEMKSQVNILRIQSDKMKQNQDYKKQQKQALIIHLQQQINKFQQIFLQKQREKKELLLQLQKNYISHREQLDILKTSYLQVEEQYKQWIQQCNGEKINLIEQYQKKISQITKNNSLNQVKIMSHQKMQQKMTKADEQLNQFVQLSIKQANQIKLLKIQLDKMQNTKIELIHKLSSIQNAMIDKNQNSRSLQIGYAKLKQQFQAEINKNKEINQLNKSINKEFVQLKNKCSVMFSQMELNKANKSNESMEIVRVRRQLLGCRQQLQRYKNNQLGMNSKLTDAVNVLKIKIQKIQQQKQQNMSDLLAQRLQNAKLKQQLSQTKQYLRREYELSLQNTKKELQQQIIGYNKRNSNMAVPYDMEKEQLYLQFRQLQRKYQLLASQIVTVDEMMGIAAKVQRRNQCGKK